MANPVAQDTAELLAGLDRHRLAKGSAELYDALTYGSATRVRDELAKVQRHPLAPELCAWLQVRGMAPPRPPTNDEVLARLGITDIEAHLQKKDAEITKLRSQLGDVETRGHQALKAATGYSFTSALLAGIALLGWLAAFGILPFAPQELPTLDTSGKSGKTTDENNGVGIEGSSK